MISFENVNVLMEAMCSQRLTTDLGFHEVSRNILAISNTLYRALEKVDLSNPILFFLSLCVTVRQLEYLLAS